jgi:hypothetical protein
MIRENIVPKELKGSMLSCLGSGNESTQGSEGITQYWPFPTKAPPQLPNLVSLILVPLGLYVQHNMLESCRVG